MTHLSPRHANSLFSLKGAPGAGADLAGPQGPAISRLDGQITAHSVQEHTMAMTAAAPGHRKIPMRHVVIVDGQDLLH
jgi:hypothetical protein